MPTTSKQIVQLTCTVDKPSIDRIHWQKTTTSRTLLGGGYARGGSIGREATKTAGSAKVTKVEAEWAYIGLESGHDDDRGGNVEISCP